MPFDGLTETPAIRRARLIEALRNDTEWEWNFCDSTGCAIGMALTIWPNKTAHELPDWLGLDHSHYRGVFGFITSRRANEQRNLDSEWCDFYGMPRTDVTPPMVAEALEKIT